MEAPTRCLASEEKIDASMLPGSTSFHDSPGSANIVLDIEQGTPPTRVRTLKMGGPMGQFFHDSDLAKYFMGIDATAIFGYIVIVSGSQHPASIPEEHLHLQGTVLGILLFSLMFLLVGLIFKYQFLVFAAISVLLGAACTVAGVLTEIAAFLPGRQIIVVWVVAAIWAAFFAFLLLLIAKEGVLEEEEEGEHLATT